MSEASKVIILSNQSGWEKLNFSDHPDLTEKDLHQLLVLIDAKNTLKVLRLNDCQNITGHGLKSLRGSTVLERVHLFDGDSKKSRLELDIIIPILDSAINLDLADLVNKIKINQELLNGHCDICVEGNEPVERCDLACLSCFKCHCGDCWTEDNNECILKCDKCELMWCRECDDFAECYSCDSVFCSDCAEDVDVDAAFACSEYVCKRKYDGQRRPLCLKCRSERMDTDTSCGECLALHHPKLVAKNEKLSEENKQMKEENNRLRREMEELRMKIAGVEMSE